MFRTIIVAGLLALATPFLALAQTLGDVGRAVTEGGQISDALRDSLVQRDDAAGRTSGVIDGEAGVFILETNDIYYAGAAWGFGYDDVPTRTNDLDDNGSAFTTASVVAGVQTVVANTVDAGASITLSGVQFTDAGAPSSRNLNASATVGRALDDGPVYASATVFVGRNFNDQFKEGQQFYGASAALSGAIRVSPRTIVRPGVGVVRQYSGEPENNSASLSLSVDARHIVNERVEVRADARMTWKKFDSFFEDVTLVERNDKTFSAGVGLNVAASQAVTVRASLGWEHQNSTFFLAEYEGATAQIGISTRTAF